MRFLRIGVLGEEGALIGVNRCKGAYRDEGAYVIRALIRIGALSRKRLL